MKKIKESVFAKLFITFCIGAGITSSSHELTEDYFSRYPSEVTLVVLIFFFLTLFLTFVVTRRILAPLKALEKGVLELAAGNLDVTLPIHSTDEFGRIEASFNHMAAEVRKMIRSKEQLLLDVSHEFRTPLSRVRIALEVDGDERASIRESVLEMEAMISELLESARMEDVTGGLKKELCDLTEIIRDLTARYEGTRPGVKVSKNETPIATKLDAPRIRIALQNLLENAVKYSSDQKRPVEVSISSRSSSVFIFVKDFGIGISKEHQELIFEPFYRVDRSRMRDTGGYGLGLSLARKIIIAHGGTLSVESDPGNGTVFSIELRQE
jgi:signal transduction histidine kinase